MATDTEQLRSGINDYARTLTHASKTLRSDLDDAMYIWNQLRQEYEGPGAEEFASAWLGSSEWFEEYLDQIGQLVQFLEERADELRNA